MEQKTLDDLAALCGARVEGDGSRRVRGPATLSEAGPDQVAFLGNERYVAQLGTTRAGGVLVGTEQAVDRDDLTLLRCDDPTSAFTHVIQAFVDPAPAPREGIHETAWVDPSATVDPTASVGPGVVIEAGATIGPRALLRSLVHVGRDSSVGADSVIEPAVVLYAGTRVGERCIVHSGAILGADGFGFEPTPEGWTKIPQCGHVLLEDDVEIGANVAIDRARFGATRVGRGSKIDNLVHLAHNVQIGAGSLVIAQAGIAGSAEIGDRVVIAGQVGVAGHTRIGSGVRIGGQSGAYSDILEPGDYMGTPARPRLDHLRALGAPKRVDRLQDRVKELERRLARLEGGEQA